MARVPANVYSDQTPLMNIWKTNDSSYHTLILFKTKNSTKYFVDDLRKFSEIKNSYKNIKMQINIHLSILS